MIFKKYLIEVFTFINMVLTISLLSFSLYEFYSKREVQPFEETNSLTVEEHVTIENSDTIFVEVKGAVATPGVYKFNSKSIINDLIIAAGGFLNNAFTNNLNLSKKMKDQMVVYVYTKYEYSLLNSKKEENINTDVCVCEKVDISSCLNTGKSVIEPSNKSTTQEEIKELTEDDKISNEQESSLININTASLEQLITLNGIGEAKAKNIISYREEHGNFSSIENIKDVTGISDTIYEKIKDYITV